MKILQIAASSDTENGTLLYGLADDGKVYFYRENYAPRENQSVAGMFYEGWTAGWHPMETCLSKPVFHKNDPKRHEHE